MHRSNVLRLVLSTLSCLAFASVLHAQGPGSGEVARGMQSEEEGNYDKAIQSYTGAVRAAPNWGHVYFLRGHVWDKKGEHDKAVADYTEALRRTPEDAASYVARGVSRSKKGEYDQAIADFTRAIEVNRQDVYFYYDLKQGKFDKGTTDGTQILRLRHADAFLHRGNAWARKGEFGKAVADYHEALRIRPKDADAACALARLQAACPDAKYRDGERAVENASRAYELSGRADWRCLDTLAAACAENGDFDRARQWQEKAIQQAGNDQSATGGDKEGVRGRLELYKAKKPFREPVKTR